MQKKLIAIAIASLGSLAGAAHADDSLTLYGLIDAGVGSYSHIGPGAGASASGFQAGQNAPNIWGMKGSEDIGNGTKVIWGLEGSMNMANGAIGANSNGNLFGREAFVGLDGKDWGTVKMGLQLDPYLLATLFTDAADLAEAGSGLNPLVFSIGETQLNAQLQGLFDNNSVSYQTPDIGNVFHATILYGFGGVAGNTSANRYWSGNAVFHQAPFLADVAYFNYNNAMGQTIDKSFHIGGSWRFNEFFKAYISYDDSKTPFGLSQTFGLNSALISEVDNWGVGLSGNFTSSLSYSIGYYRTEDKNNTSDRATTAAAQLNYKMSKHTTLYGIVDQLKAGSDGAGSGIMNGYAGTSVPGGGLVFPGNSSTGFSLGMTHSF